MMCPAFMQPPKRIWGRNRHKCSERRTPSANTRRCTCMSASDRGSGRRYHCSDSHHVAERADETAASRGDDESLPLSSLASARRGASHAIRTMSVQPLSCASYLLPCYCDVMMGAGRSSQTERNQKSTNKSDGSALKRMEGRTEGLPVTRARPSLNKRLHVRTITSTRVSICPPIHP